MRLITMATPLVLLAFLSGCASTSLRDGWSAATASIPRWGNEKDSILKSDSIQTKLTPEFKSAQRKLKNAESMLLAHARLLEDQEKYAEARQRYRELITAYPKSVSAAVGLARIEHKTGRVEQAEAILQELRDEHPRSVPVRIALGSLYADRGQFDQAVETYATAVDLDPENQTLRYELGIALARTSRLEQALPHLKFAVGESAATYNIGYLMYEEGRTEEAMRWFNAALEGHPDEQTRQQASRMIAQLSPAPAAAQPAGAPDIQTASAVRSMPETVSPMMPQTPSVVPARAATMTRVLPANHSPAPPQPAAAGSVFRTASHSVSTSARDARTTVNTAPTVSGTATSDVPQWRGANSTAAAEPVPPVSESATPTRAAENSVQQPPMWRSRNR